MPIDLVFRHVPVDSRGGASLVTAMAAEMRELYWDVCGGGLDTAVPARGTRSGCMKRRAWQHSSARSNCEVRTLPRSVGGAP
jgi:hypothetical protein